MLKTLARLLFLASIGGPLLAQGEEAPMVINVEVDYMEDSTHSHAPSQAVIDALVDMFACHGVTLNFVLDEAIPHVPVIRCLSPSTFGFFSCMHPRGFATMKANYAQNAGTPGWHYAIMGHDYDAGSGTGSSGLAEGCGGDFVVTLGSFAETDFQVAGTFAHELGHTLGLGHASYASTIVSGQYAPNYASVMAYRYQLGGVKSQMECLGLTGNAHLFKDLDYSSGRLPTLTETMLEESVGMGIHPVDWTCDGALTPGMTGQELDQKYDWCDTTQIGFSTLVDQNDWSLLCNSTEQPDVYLDLIDHPVVTCITADEYQAGLQDPSACPAATPTLSTEPCPSGLMAFVDPDAGIFQLGTGDSPFKTLSTAVLAVPSNSVLFLQEGTYAAAQGPIVITKPLVLTGPGGAIVDP